MSQEYGINMPLANPTLIPDEIMSLFGRPPVVVTESKDVYLRQLECIAAAIGPEDIIEWIMVKAIADLSWEIARYERAKAGIIDSARKPALVNILCSILEEGQIKSTCDG